MQENPNDRYTRLVRAAKATVSHQLRSLREKGTVYQPKPAAVDSQANDVFARRVQAAKATVAHQLRSLREKGTVYKPK